MQHHFHRPLLISTLYFTLRRPATSFRRLKLFLPELPGISTRRLETTPLGTVLCPPEIRNRIIQRWRDRLPEHRPHLPFLLQRLYLPFQCSDRRFLMRFDLPLDVVDPSQRPVDAPELDLIENPLEPGRPLPRLCLCQRTEESDLPLPVRFELLQNDPR